MSVVKVHRRFKPLTDITVIELAKILMKVPTPISTVTFSEDQWERLDYSIKRHFVEDEWEG